MQQWNLQLGNMKVATSFQFLGFLTLHRFLLFLQVLLVMPVCHADLVLSRAVKIKGYNIKIGPMVQTVGDRDQTVKYYVSRNGVRVEAIMGLERRVLIYNKALDKIWTVDTSNLTYYQGALDDYREQVAQHPEARTAVTQDLPIVTLKFEKSQKRGRFRGYICRLIDVVGSGQVDNKFCILEFAKLGMSADEVAAYKGLLKKIAPLNSDVLYSLITDWGHVVGIDGIDIFGLYTYKVSGLPISTQTAIKLDQVETRVLGSNLFMPPETFNQMDVKTLLQARHRKSTSLPSPIPRSKVQGKGTVGQGKDSTVVDLPD